MSDTPKCELCDEPMPEGEEMFKYHGYSCPCPAPPLPRKQTGIERLTAELNQARAKLREAQDYYKQKWLGACYEIIFQAKSAESAESKLASLTQELEQLRQEHDWACKSEGICPSCDNPYFVSVSWEKDPNCDDVEVPVKHCGNCGESFCDHSAMLIRDTHRAHKKELEQLRARYAGAVGLLKKYRELTKGASPNDWHAFYEATAEALSSTPQTWTGREE